MHIRDKIKALTPKLTRQGYAHISRAGTSNRGKPRVNVNVTEGRHPSPQKKPVATPRGKMPTPSSRGVRGSGNPLGNSTPNVDRVQFRHNVSRGAAQEIQGVANKPPYRSNRDAVRRGKSLSADQDRAESFVKRLSKS